MTSYKAVTGGPRMPWMRWRRCASTRSVTPSGRSRPARRPDGKLKQKRPGWAWLSPTRARLSPQRAATAAATNGPAKPRRAGCSGHGSSVRVAVATDALASHRAGALARAIAADEAARAAHLKAHQRREVVDKAIARRRAARERERERRAEAAVDDLPRRRLT